MKVTMYGIPNCDTIKKAKKWLTEHNVEFDFHDYRKQGIDAEMMTQFCQALGWENVVNKRGTTFRQLSQEQKEGLNEQSAMTLLVEQPAMIKRPILFVDGQYHLGFKADQYAAVFA
ncbi:ArsC family reductase [Vibrio renipiscarius]|uniref:ArsC family transcriptional regulator n=1 Tax=Vibrio renipiscarius TaxID=1461322 RepID=A0A0C2NB05_9VIBR|nr:ArsC family reductase [Vibrio renipiscarius]KII76811.1 ArsC family transcriptional regulator [Vibrio renipiscarius]KII76939.1 ArsC family transcriptional regulator [Vibrio renipiscarius]